MGANKTAPFTISATPVAGIVNAASAMVDPWPLQHKFSQIKLSYIQNLGMGLALLPSQIQCSQKLH
jgi:hypothetical protein